MNIVIIGAGAIGLLFYQSLKKHNNRCPPTNIQLLQYKTPLHSISFTNNQHASLLIPVNLISVADIEQADVILICVKSYQVAEVVKYISFNLQPNTVVILAHNGMGTLSAFTPYKNPILALLTTHGCRRITRRHIIHTGIGESYLGQIKGSISNHQQQQITQTLDAALPKVYWQENINEKQWLKLAINCVINPLTALYGINNGALCLSQYRDEIINILQEVISVAALEGIHFELTTLLSTVLTVAKNTQNNHSSMLSDVQQRQPTEIAFINGYLVTLAKKHQITLLKNERLCQKVSALTPLAT